MSDPAHNSGASISEAQIADLLANCPILGQVNDVNRVLAWFRTCRSQATGDLPLQSSLVILQLQAAEISTRAVDYVGKKVTSSMRQQGLQALLNTACALLDEHKHKREQHHQQLRQLAVQAIRQGAKHNLLSAPSGDRQVWLAEMLARLCSVPESAALIVTLVLSPDVESLSAVFDDTFKQDFSV